MQGEARARAVDQQGYKVEFSKVSVGVCVDLLTDEDTSNDADNHSKRDRLGVCSKRDLEAIG